MKKTRLLTSLSALALVLSLGACDVSLFEQEQKEFTISFESNGYVYAIGLPESADEGDKIEFVLAAQSGFRIEDVEAGYVADSRYTILDLEGDASGYSFVMPAADVSISAKGVGGYYSISYDRNEEVFVTEGYSSYKQLHFVDGIYEQGSGELLGSDEKTFVQAGSEVMIVGKHQQEAGEPRYFLDGEELEQLTDEELNCGYFAFGFVMPNKDVELKVSVSERHITAVLEENELVDAYLYTVDDENKTPLTSVSDLIIDNDKIYVHAELKSGIDSSRYSGINRITVGADVYSDAAKVATSYSTKELSESPSESGDYSVYVPYWYYTSDEVTISVDVIDELKYQGYDFVGNWTGTEIWNSKAYGSASSLNISTSGTLTYPSGSFSGSNWSGATINEVSADGQTLSLSNGNPFYLSADGKIGFTYFYGSSTNTNDTLLFAKATENVSFSTFMIWGALQYVAEVTVNGESWGFVYADSNNYTTGQNLFVDVSIEFTGTSTSFDELDKTNEVYPTFDVLDANGNVLASITGAEDYYFL